MDYIQEELLRQKRALEILMTGGVSQMEKTAESAEPERFHEMRGTEEMLHGREAAVRRMTGGERRSLRAGTSGVAESDRARSSSAQETLADGVVREVRFVSRSQTAQADAQAISRTIQRDARRYDGGFSLY